jgi:hypothetical protein
MEAKESNGGAGDDAKAPPSPSSQKDDPPPSTTQAASSAQDHPKPPSKVTLSDVQNAFPAESTEERIVMEHIERTDPTMGDATENDENWETLPTGNRIYKAPPPPTTRATSQSSSSLLDQATALPPELVASMQEEKVQQMMEEERKASLERSKSRRRQTGLTHQPPFFHKGPKTVENELFELTNMLRPRQSGEYENTTNADANDDAEGGSPEVEVEEEMKPLTQTQAFAAHAAGMFQHLTKKVERRSPSFPGVASFGGDSRRNSNNGGAESDGDKHSRHSTAHKQFQLAMENVKEVERIIERGRKSIFQYARTMFLFIILPCTAIAFLLYYAFDNPGADIIYVVDPNAITNTTDPDANTPQRIVSNTQPSYSWLFLFFGVRQVITFGLAVGLQHLTVTYYQQAGLNFTLVGPMGRLLIIQAKVICFFLRRSILLDQ